MANSHFRFKQFNVLQDKAVFKVGTDGVLLGAWGEVTGIKNILDIGTGTGLIALMIAQRCNAFITAIEPETDSYEQAVENVKNSRWSGRIKVENSTFQNFCSVSKESFDLILSNPPYFNNSLKNPDSRKSGTRHTELLSSSDILSGALKLLSDNGKLRIILPYAEGTLFIAEASLYRLYCNNIVKIKTHPSGQVRRLLLEFERLKRPLKEKFLTIENGKRHEYSVEYIELTKEYYLYF